MSERPSLMAPTHTRSLRSTAAVVSLATAGDLPARRAHAADMTVGFIHVGPRYDYDYTQAHAANPGTPGSPSTGRAKSTWR